MSDQARCKTHMIWFDIWQGCELCAYDSNAEILCGDCLIPAGECGCKL